MLELDTQSLLVSSDTEITISELENRLNRKGFSLNYLALPDNKISLREAVGQRLPNLFWRGFGGIQDLVLQIRLVQDNGEVWTNVLVPRAATGPSFKKLSIGRGKGWGVPVQATLRMFHKPERRHLAIAFFKSEKDRLSFFEKLKRWPEQPALCQAVEPSLLKKWFKMQDGFGEFLLIAHWGERKTLDTFWPHLLQLIEQQKGRWIERSFERYWKKILPHLELSLPEEAIASEQLQLEKKIREIA